MPPSRIHMLKPNPLGDEEVGFLTVLPWDMVSFSVTATHLPAETSLGAGCWPR